MSIRLPLSSPRHRQPSHPPPSVLTPSRGQTDSRSYQSLQEEMAATRQGGIVSNALDTVRDGLYLSSGGRLGKGSNAALNQAHQHAQARYTQGTFNNSPERDHLTETIERRRTGNESWLNGAKSVGAALGGFAAFHALGRHLNLPSPTFRNPFHRAYQNSQLIRQGRLRSNSLLQKLPRSFLTRVGKQAHWAIPKYVLPALVLGGLTRLGMDVLEGRTSRDPATRARQNLKGYAAEFGLGSLDGTFGALGAGANTLATALGTNMAWASTSSVANQTAIQGRVDGRQLFYDTAIGTVANTAGTVLANVAAGTNRPVFTNAITQNVISDTAPPLVAWGADRMWHRARFLVQNSREPLRTQTP